MVDWKIASSFIYCASIMMQGLLTSSVCAATTLTGLHFATTTLMTVVLRWLGYIQPSHLPYSELLKFIFFANFSIVGMNVSLMWNSVGFYQVFIIKIPPWVWIFVHKMNTPGPIF